MKRFLKSIPLLLVSLILFSGCNEPVKAFSSKYDSKSAKGIESALICENGRYNLTWDNENKCVFLECKENGKIWSTIPYEYLNGDGMNAVVRSPLNIVIADVNTLKVSDINGTTSAVLDGSVLAHKIKDGIKVTYYFEEQKISIPIIYKLDKDALLVTLDSKNICEGANFKVMSVQIAPFLCSSSNEEGNYLFIPSNSGALMNTAVDTAGTRKYSGEIYGNDAAHLDTKEREFTSEIKMPVFGAKNKDNALFVVVEDGAERVTLMAEAGNKKTGWSSVWPSVSVRGSDVIKTQLPQARVEDISYISEVVADSDVTLRYVPLFGEDADYNGMAKWYRDYLKKSGLISEKSENSSPYSLNIYGGALINQLFLGVPYKTVYPFTTWDKAGEIVNKLIGETKLVPELHLVGFGESGVNIGKIGSGFDFSAKIGSKKQRNAFLNFCEQNEINYFFNYDLIRFNDSSLGFSTLSDTAKTASQHKATQNFMDVALAGALKDEEYNFLKRSKIENVTDKLIKITSKNNIKGISLDSMGKISYSDYSSAKYACKSGYANQVINVVKTAKAANVSVAFENANLYAALFANTVFSAPDIISDNKAISMSVPFYQEVLGNNCNMYSSPVNAASSAKERVMLSAAYGMGISFDCIDEYSLDLRYNEYNIFSAVFKEQFKTISNTVKSFSKDYEKFSNSYIVSYKMLNDEISETCFENGVKIYANHANCNTEFEKYKLSAFQYIVVS